jgi:HEAT repeat protein
MRWTTTNRLGLGVLACCLVASAAAPTLARAGGAKPPAKRADAASPPALTAATLAKLKSSDPVELRAGLDDARLAGPKGAAAVPPIVALLHGGLTYPLAEAAIDTLGDIESSEGVVALVPYASHREAKVRRSAIRALARTPSGPAVVLAAATLRAALSDPDSLVRSSAATGLGSLKAKAAVIDLFLALDHRVYEAAASIGQLCSVAECDALVSRLGKVPFDVISTGLDQVLFRPTAEVSDDAKLGVIHRVRDLGTRDANKFLHDVQGRWPKGGSPAVRRELDAAVLATLSSPGGDR